MKIRQRRFPRAPKGAEIILKYRYGCEYSEHHEERDVKSGMLLLGNASGLRWLSRYCLWMADRIDEEAAFCEADPHDHQHFDTDAPVNQTFSDGMFVTFGSLPRQHRQRVLRALGITKAGRRAGYTLPLVREIIRGFRAEPPDSIPSAHLVSELEALGPELEKTCAKLKADAAQRSARSLG